jgi:hypothetical protein
MRQSDPLRLRPPLQLPTQTRPSPGTPLLSQVQNSVQLSHTPRLQNRGLHKLQATQHLQASPHPNFRRDPLHLHRLSVLQSHCKTTSQSETVHVIYTTATAPIATSSKTVDSQALGSQQDASSPLTPVPNFTLLPH